MAVTITTSTSVTSTKMARASFSNGVAVYNLANTRFEFWFTSDGGATWSESTALRITAASPTGASFSGDGSGGVFAWTSSGATKVYDTVGGVGGAWADISSSFTTTNCTAVDILCNGLDVHVLTHAAGGAVTLQSRRNRGGSPVSTASSTLEASGLASSQYVALEINGNFLWAVYRDSSDTICQRITVNTSGSVAHTAVNAQRVLDANTPVAAAPLTAVFDGTRLVTAFTWGASDTTMQWAERDAGDTATTSRTPTFLSDGAITSLSLSYSLAGDTRLFAVGTTSDDVKRLTFSRSGGTFSSWQSIEATTATAATMTAGARPVGSNNYVVWTSGAGSPYDVLFEADGGNVPPNAPSWATAAGAYDRGAGLLLDWNFEDADPDDTQSAYALSRSVNGGALAYYNAGAGTWGGGETKNTSTTTSVTLASGWAADGDIVEYKVKTWDFLDEVSVYGSGLTILASVPVTPVLTAPTDASTITVNKVTVTWTATEQTAYRLRLLTSADVQVWDSGKTTSTTKTVEIPTILADGFSGKVEVRVWNDDDLLGGTDTHTFSVDYIEPATPTLVVTAEATSGRMKIVVTDPAPTGGQPTVTSRDLFVRVAAGGRQDGERTVGGDGIRIQAAATATTLYDYAAASGVNYQYLVRAIASNGTSKDSAWT